MVSYKADAVGVNKQKVCWAVYVHGTMRKTGKKKETNEKVGTEFAYKKPAGGPAERKGRKMKIIGATEREIREAARFAGVGLRLTPLANNGRSWRVRLLPIEEKFYRLGPTGRRVHAVCWHGHYAFFVALFVLCPIAKVRTALAKYDGYEHFWQTYHKTRSKNIGSTLSSWYYENACFC
jgi:hypothetical protein